MAALPPPATTIIPPQPNGVAAPTVTTIPGSSTTSVAGPSVSPITSASTANTSPVPNAAWQAYQPSLVSNPPPNATPHITKANGQPIAPEVMQAIRRLPGGATMPPELVAALATMADIRPFPGVSEYVRSMGIDVIFPNGGAALDTIMQKNIRVIFDDMGDTTAHAEWRADQNTMVINQKYRGDASPTMLYAISEALFHESGHAACDGDGYSSIQEETNCLFLNAWANYGHQQESPAYAQTTHQSELLSNGVALYTKLFFQDPDPEKKALVRRIALKYGMLPVVSPGHLLPKAEQVAVPGNLNPGWWMGQPNIATRVINYVIQQNTMRGKHSS